jgi:hypothetical protein
MIIIELKFDIVVAIRVLPEANAKAKAIAD